MRTVSQGAVIHIAAVFTNAAGELTDPTTVTFHIQSEAGTTEDTYVYGTDLNVVRSSTGVYFIAQDTSDQSGVYDYWIIGTGAAVGGHHGQFYVEPMNLDDESSSCSDESG